MYILRDIDIYSYASRLEGKSLFFPLRDNEENLVERMRESLDMAEEQGYTRVILLVPLFLPVRALVEAYKEISSSKLFLSVPSCNATVIYRLINN